MSAQHITIRSARPSRAGIAVGAAIVAAWAGAVAIEFANEDRAHEREHVSQGRFTDASFGWPARPGSSSYVTVFR